jgi:ADP-dependent phosphofructokinase/glucokinase
VPLDAYPVVFALFNAKKDSIYGLYRDSIGQLMRPSDVKETLRYYDEFYKTINDPKSARENIEDACLGPKPKR